VVLYDDEYFTCTVEIRTECIYREGMDLLEADRRDIRIQPFSRFLHNAVDTQETDDEKFTFHIALHFERLIHREVLELSHPFIHLDLTDKRMRKLKDFTMDEPFK